MESTATNREGNKEMEMEWNKEMEKQRQARKEQREGLRRTSINETQTTGRQIQKSK